jgi:Ferritin-like domain
MSARGAKPGHRRRRTRLAFVRTSAHTVRRIPSEGRPDEDGLTFGELDRDGALAEAMASVAGDTRAHLLRKALVGGAALLGAGALPAQALAEDDNDTHILNYALTLELIQDSFYSEVERLGAITGPLAEQARIVAAHERAHVRAFQDVLGDQAVKRARFDFRGATENADRFRRTAVAFEDLAVAAYKGAAPLIKRRAYLVPALAIHTVEARHAAWIRRLAGITPAAAAFDEPRTEASTLRVVERANFTVDMQSTGSAPRFTG